MANDGGRRSRRSHRFTVTVDLVTADIDAQILASNLTRLSTAGLHGMVSRIVRTELDGQVIETSPDAPLRQLRPPVDERVPVVLSQARKSLEDLSRLLLGVEASEAVA